MQLIQNPNAQQRPSTERLSYTVPGACAATGLGKTSIYEAIKRGELKSFLACGRRLILKSDLEAFLTSCRGTT
jgi:excisionase family DNA binding protein